MGAPHRWLHPQQTGHHTRGADRWRLTLLRHAARQVLPLACTIRDFHLWLKCKCYETQAGVELPPCDQDPVYRTPLHRTAGLRGAQNRGRSLVPAPPVCTGCPLGRMVVLYFVDDLYMTYLPTYERSSLPLSSGALQPTQAHVGWPLALSTMHLGWATDLCCNRWAHAPRRG